MPLPCGVMEIAQSLPGVDADFMAVTVRQFKISSGVCSRFKPHLGPLLRFWKMDLSLLGVMQITLAVTVRMDLSVRDQLKGVQQIQATRFGLCCDSGRWICRDLGIVPTYGGDSSAVRDQLKGVQQIQADRLRPLLRFWKMDPSLPGVMQTLAVTVRQFEIS